MIARTEPYIVRRKPVANSSSRTAILSALSMISVGIVGYMAGSAIEKMERNRVLEKLRSERLERNEQIEYSVDEQRNLDSYNEGIDRAITLIENGARQ